MAEQEILGFICTNYGSISHGLAKQENTNQLLGSEQCSELFGCNFHHTQARFIDFWHTTSLPI